MILKNGKRMDTVLDNLPIGTINCFGGSVAPTGWLICDGSAISRTIYSELFSVIGTTYGTGDGSTTFNLPDYRGKIGVGYSNGDTDFGTLGKTGGEKTHTLTINEMPSHSHTYIGFARNITNTDQVAGAGVISTQNPYDDSTSSTGGGEAHNNLQPYITINYIIKVYMVIPVNSSVYNALDSTSTTDALSANQGKVLNDKINGTILYDNDAGTTGTVTLSDSAANYNYLEIYFFNTADNIYSSVKVYKPNDKSVDLTAGAFFGNQLYFKSANRTISGTSISLKPGTIDTAWNITNSTAGTAASTSIKIHKVVGYK